MPLVPFSEPDHIPLLLTGKKMQTTRQPGKTPLKVGDVLHCYFKPRQSPSCKNCIVRRCPHEKEKETIIPQLKISNCSEWSNCFGAAVITKIIRAHYGIADATDVRDIQIVRWNPEWQEDWAVADGFESFDDALEWFSSRHGCDWMDRDWDIITFDPKWIKPSQNIQELR